MNIIGWNIKDEDTRKGMLSSILLHLILLLICLMPFVFTTSQDQETQQIIVTFSDLNDETPSASAPASSSTVEEVTEENKEDAQDPESKPTNTTDRKTQEKTEKTLVKQETKPKKVINKPSPEQETSPVKVEEISAQKRAESVKKVKEEAMRREAERRAKEEAEKKRKAEELAKKKSSFGSLFNNTESEKTEQETEGKGEDISAYIQPTHTIGGGLGNRSVLFEPTVTDSSRKVGRVVISICVDRAGQVSSANFTQKGSTTSDAQLIKLAKLAALKYRFNTSELAEQCGSVTFEFTLK